MAKRPDVVSRNKSREQREKNSDSWRDPAKRKQRIESLKKPHKLKDGYVSPMKGRTHSRQAIQKMRQSHLELHFVPWNKGLTAKTNTKVAAYGRRSGTSRKGKPGHWRGKKRPDAAIKIRETMASGKMKKVFNTKPELKMKVLLNALGVHYVFQAHESGYMMDFYIPSKRLNVEVDGEYWHNFPHGREKDRMRDADLESKGYKVIRFWAQDVFAMSAISI